MNITQEKIPFIKSYLEKKGHIFNTNLELKKFVADMNYYDEERLDTAYRAYKKRKKDISNDEKTIGISLRNSAYLSLLAMATAQNLSFSDLIEKLTKPEKKPRLPTLPDLHDLQSQHQIENPRTNSMANTLMSMQAMREEKAKYIKAVLDDLEIALKEAKNKKISLATLEHGIEKEIQKIDDDRYGFTAEQGKEEHRKLLVKVFKDEYQQRLDDICKQSGMTKKEFLSFYRLESERAASFEEIKKWLPELFIKSL